MLIVAGLTVYETLKYSLDFLVVVDIGIQSHCGCGNPLASNVPILWIG
jgi:hypothetical protein